MKKVLSFIALFAILGASVPAIAAPPPHAGKGHVVHAGPHRAPAPPPHHYYRKGSAVFGGVLARRGYWGYPYCCDYRLGCYTNCYEPGVYINLGIPIRF